MKMLEIMKKTYPEREITKDLKENLRQEIVITKYEEEITYENGAKIIRKIPHNVNITKMVNESKKLVKNYTAEEKLAELEKVFTK